LTDREKEVVELATEGKTSKEIGEFLNLSGYIVDSHRHNILEKTNMKFFQELIS